MSAGTLYLIPTLLGAGTVAEAIPPLVLERLRRLRYFIVEEPRSARAFLRAAEHPGPLAAVRLDRLGPQPDEAALARLLEPLLEGADAAILSDAGAPAVADPGAALVRHAHAQGVRVVPLVGPSAILLALMASGLEGQRFAFHGYLPVDQAVLKTRLRALEAASRRERRAEIFIETPYRNDRLLRVITATCASETLLSVAADLTLATETIATRTIAAWRATRAPIGKRPAVFLLLA